MFILTFSTVFVVIVCGFNRLHSIEINVKVGEKLELCCTLKIELENSMQFSSPSARIATLHKDLLTQADVNELKDASFTVSKRDNTICLIKNSVEKKDGNKDFKCTEIKGSFGATIQSETISFKIFEELMFIDRIPDVTKISMGESPTIECKASGSPDLKVLWRKENQGVITQGTSEAILKITDVTSAMNGDKYTCEASVSIPKEGPNSMIKQTTTLSVLFPPEIKVELKPFHTDLGIKEVVKITVNGNPPPSLNCKLLNIAADRIITISEPKPSTYIYEMVFNNITQNDIGDYKCSATNSKGETEKTISLILGPINLRITSPNETNYANYYLLKWKVESKAKINLSKIVIDEYEAGIDSVSKQRILEKTELLPEVTMQGNEDNNWQFEYSQNVLNLTENKLHKISLQMCRKDQCIDAEQAIYVKTPKNDGKNFMEASALSSSKNSAFDNQNKEAMMTVRSLNAIYTLGVNLIVLGLLYH